MDTFFGHQIAEQLSYDFNISGDNNTYKVLLFYSRFANYFNVFSLFIQ